MINTFIYSYGYSRNESVDNDGSGETSTTSENNDETLREFAGHSEDNRHNSFKRKRKSRRKYAKHASSTSWRNPGVSQGIPPKVYTKMCIPIIQK